MARKAFNKALISLREQQETRSLIPISGVEVMCYKHGVWKSNGSCYKCNVRELHRALLDPERKPDEALALSILILAAPEHE